MTQLSPLQEHWAEINEIRAELEKLPAIYLCSIYDRKKRITAGRICVASPQIGAIMIASKSHRLATKDEIAAWKEEQEIRGGKQTQTQAKKESKINLDFGSMIGTLTDQIRRQVEEQLNQKQTANSAPAPAAQAVAPASTPAPAPSPHRPVAPAVQIHKGHQATPKPLEDKLAATDNSA